MENERLARDITDDELKAEIFSGKRSGPMDAMTEMEMDELEDLICEYGGLAYRKDPKSTILHTTRKDLYDKYLKDYVKRKMKIAGLI